MSIFKSHFSGLENSLETYPKTRVLLYIPNILDTVSFPASFANSLVLNLASHTSSFSYPEPFDYFRNGILQSNFLVKKRNDILYNHPLTHGNYRTACKNRIIDPCRIFHAASPFFTHITTAHGRSFIEGGVLK